MAKVFTFKNVYAGVFGTIVLITWVYGFVGSAANVRYGMSKPALHGVTKSLSIELVSNIIRVNCVAPVFVKSRLLNTVSSSFNQWYFNTLQSLHPLGIGEAQEVANALAFLLSDRDKWIAGTVLGVDGGFTA